MKISLAILLALTGCVTTSTQFSASIGPMQQFCACHDGLKSATVNEDGSYSFTCKSDNASMSGSDLHDIQTLANALCPQVKRDR